MKTAGKPLEENLRLTWIDAARGFAIFGIFMVNTPAFNAPFFLYGGEGLYWSEPLDHLVQTLIDIFFQASFYTLFSFLFGFGIQLMADRLRDKQLDYRKIIFRRLLVLIGFGALHAFLIWHGDILLTYGLIGLLLLLFLRSSSSTLLFWGFSLLIGSSLLITGMLYSIRDMIQEPVNRQAINQALENYGNGSLLDIWRQNYEDWIYANGGDGYLFLIFSLLPLFLFGMYTARKRWLHDINIHKQFLIKMWFIMLVLFAVFKAGPYLAGNPYWFSYAQDTIGGTASAIFYLLSITLLYAKGSRIANPLTHVGRMALTNYLFQSVFSFFLYYSIGIGLYGNIRPIWSVLITVIVFLMQIAGSSWWMKHFKYGPFEWLWRSLTYGERQKIRRRAVK